MTTSGSKSAPPFEYAATVKEYMVSPEEYLKQHPEYTVLVTGAVVFDADGKLLLVQRAKDEKAFPNLWEIPGGTVDSTDESLLHAAARELKEETGLEASRVVRKVGQFTFKDLDRPRPDGSIPVWVKHVFEMEVKDLSKIELDPVEHQAYLFATEEEVVKGKAGEVELIYVSEDSRTNKLDAFSQRKERTRGDKL